MKNMFARLALAAALGSLLISIQPLLAQGTAFTYQGQLSASGSPANGNYDFQFSLFNAATAGSQVGSTITQTAIGVTNGMFMATIDFGPGIFTGPNYWLAINVRSNNVGSYTALTPLQALTPTPYAIYTPNAGSAATATSATTATTAGNFTGPLVGNVTGTQGATVVSSVGSAALPGAQLTGTVPSSALNGVNGSGLTSLTAANIAAGTAGISITGNAATATSATSAATATTAASFSGALAGDVTGTQGATAVSLVGGQTAANVASGASAANALLTTNVEFSFFAGQSAGNGTTSASDNTGLGYQALHKNTIGGSDTATGYEALYNNVGGSENTAFGAIALVDMTSGAFNTAIGYNSLPADTTDNFNTALGANTLVSHTSGNNNTAIGYQALLAHSSGTNNIALGNQAGENLSTGSGNIYIGSIGGAAGGTENNIIRIGSNQTTAYIAGAITGNGSGLTNLSAAQLTGSSEVAPPANGYPILNMVYIVPGTFVMGAPTSDPDYASDETQHVVTLTNGFWMGQHPVTQGEYLAVVGNNPSAFTGDLSRPVESVTWFNAGTFCTNLTQNEQSAGRLPSGWVYRLPTESEWEYCCRALTTSRYYFGNDPGDGTSLTNYAWYNVNSGSTTQPVGQLLPNAWGLVDMAGNVSEWCQDWYGTYPTANVSYNPRGPATGSYRVLRGGSWYFPAIYCRSAYRDYLNPTIVYDGYGFRVVLAPGP